MPQFVFSTSVDGKIKAWLYDMMGSRVDYDTPGRSCTAMAYSADGKRFRYWKFYTILMFSFESNPIMENLKSRCFD
jgi:hypothetical protein